MQKQASSSHLTKSDRDVRSFGVRMYWDLNRTSFPRQFASTIFERITSALQRFDHRYFLKSVVGYGDFNAYGGPKAFLHEEDIEVRLEQLLERPVLCNKDNCQATRGSKTELPHHLLKQDIFYNTIKDDPPYIILLVTSDPDFAPIITQLKDMGYIVLLACHQNAELEGANIKWYWEQMIDRFGPLGR